MKKREIKDIEERLLSKTDVPDGVLDSARAELDGLRYEGEHSGRAITSAPASGVNGGRGAAAQAVSRRRIAVIAVAACLLVVVAVVLIVVFTLPKSKLGEEPLYAFAELEEREIGSVAEYNVEYGTEYLCAEEGATQGYAYSDGSRDVLLSESFSYGGSDCVLYVLTDSYDNRVDILQPFYDCIATATAGGIEVYYDGDAFAAAYFYSGSAAYFISLEGGGFELLFGALEYLIG